MSDLITQLRGMANAGTADITLGGITYHTDEQLQSTLDRHREQVEREMLDIRADYQNGTAIYTRYGFYESDVERATSGTAAWRIENSAGSAYSGTVGTAAADYGVNYDAREITFNSNTNGTVYYLTYRTYDMNRAAADVWEEKAAYVAGEFDVKTDNHDLKRSQKGDGYLEMAKIFKRRAKPRSSRFIREDVW